MTGQLCCGGRMPINLKSFMEIFLILLGLGVLLAGICIAGRAYRNRRRR